MLCTTRPRPRPYPASPRPDQLSIDCPQLHPLDSHDDNPTPTGFSYGLIVTNFSLDSHDDNPTPTTIDCPRLHPLDSHELLPPRRRPRSGEVRAARAKRPGGSWRSAKQAACTAAEVGWFPSDKTGRPGQSTTRRQAYPSTDSGCADLGLLSSCVISAPCRVRDHALP
jgi:hypothetical protein